jgi:hypothetical protein
MVQQLRPSQGPPKRQLQSSEWMTSGSNRSMSASVLGVVLGVVSGGADFSLLLAMLASNPKSLRSDTTRGANLFTLNPRIKPQPRPALHT